MAWVTARAAAARRTASVCTGAYLLAATGILDGRRAATHWSFCDDLARSFPAVRVEPDPIFVRDGPVWTSAGVTAGIDLALALLEEDLGRDVALAVARYLVVFLKRPGGQAQFSAALSLQAGEAPFGKLHAWIDANLARDLSLSTLAAQAGNERAQLQPPLSRSDRPDAGAGSGAASGRSRSPASLRHQGPHQAHRAPMRLRNGGDDAPQLPAPAVDLPAGLSRPFQSVSARRRRVARNVG